MTASGDGSVAAGDDVDITNINTNIDVGDIYTDNTWNTDSFNTDNSENWQVNDSFNPDLSDMSVNDSFNDNSTEDSQTTWTWT